MSTAPEDKKMTGNLKICFLADDTEKAQKALSVLEKRYGGVSYAKADMIVALGGDGFMLQTLHKCIGKDLPVYGMNRGTVGFLMNGYRQKDLMCRLENAQKILLHPLKMKAVTAKGKEKQALAINEVSLFRSAGQAASIRINVNGQEKLSELICDGILLSTPAGSTAYNLSAHGPILPLASNVLALTPISPFRPRNWRGAILPSHVSVEFDILQHEKRPVSAVADSAEIKNVVTVQIQEDRRTELILLFDPEYNLEDRVLNEQFLC